MKRVWIFAACSVWACSEASPYEGDFLKRREDGIRWVFPEAIPVQAGKTREADLDGLLADEPKQRITFRIPFVHDPGTGPVTVSRIRVYDYGRVAKTLDGQGLQGIENLTIVVFCHQGTVQAFTVKHLIRENQDQSPWKPGKLDTGAFAVVDEVSPGIVRIIERYTCERGLAFADEHGSYLLASDRGREAGCPQIPLEERTGGAWLEKYRQVDPKFK